MSGIMLNQVGGSFGSLGFTEGSLWTWGGNFAGTLGLGNTTKYSSPKQVGSLTTWATASGLRNQAGGVDSAGRLYMWGQNAVGSLGLGNTNYYSSPKQVGALTNWLSVNGYNVVVAIKTNGTIWGWGQNNNGQLGLGNTTNYSSPKQVGSLTKWHKADILLSGCIAQQFK